MTPERYEQIGQIFHAALDLKSNDRNEYIKKACGSDDELRNKVELLLEAHHHADEFIGSSALEMIGELPEVDGSPTLSAGFIIGHYRIISLLAAGGMGQVYLAEDTKLRRNVALKLLPKEFTKDQERVDRFELEAQAASSLNHPNILTIHEIGHSDDNYFIATELILGETLRSMMLKGKISTREALDIAAQIAGALDVSHTAGVIHRDIKPENIMVRQDGIVKVLDFGLTKLIKHPELIVQKRADQAESLESNPNNTQSGFVLGTVKYMSPEQTRDSSLVDHRTDLWSLSVVLYEVLTGHLPFDGNDLKQRITAIQESDPLPLSSHSNEIPKNLEEIVRKGLEKLPSDRYQSAKEMLIEFRSLTRNLDDQSANMVQISNEWTAANLQRSESHPEKISQVTLNSETEVVAGKSKHFRLALISLIVFGILTLIMGFWAYNRFIRDSSSDNSSLAVLKVIPFTSFPGKEAEPSFSPDGKMIAFSWNGSDGENFDIYVKSLDDNEPKRITNQTGADRSPSWSPDGLNIAFIRTTEKDDSIVIVPAVGGTESILYSINRFARGDALGQSVSWSPDGKSLLFSEKESLLVPFQIKQLSVENQEKRRLTSPPVGYTGDRLPIISPRGDTLAFVRRRGNDTDEIYLVPISGGEPTPLTADHSMIAGLVWTSDGQYLIYSSNSGGTQHLWKVPSVGGTPERIPAGEENPDTLAMSPQGRRLAYSSAFSDMNIWRVEVPNTNGKNISSPIKLISSTRTDNSPQYSPDGKKVVYASSRTGPLEIWTCDSDGTNQSRLTSFGGAHLGSPRWSPDGLQIVFDSVAEGSRDIYVIGADGSNLRRLTTEDSLDTRPSWSRDGRFIYFGSDRSGDWQVWKVPAEGGGQAMQLTKNGGREAFESFDGKLVYYTKFDAVGLWRVPTEGGEEIKVLDQVWQGGWTLWEQGVYFVKTEPGLPSSVELYLFSTSQTKKITTIGKAVFWGGPAITSTSDGRSILYVNIDQTESDILLIENF